jgi:tRNA pseudouridine13 synthase
VIKSLPEDFRVEELLTPEAARRIAGTTGAFAVFRLTKRALATDEAVERVARRLGLPLSRIAYGGLKDKHALTTQYISIEGGVRRTRLMAQPSRPSAGPPEAAAVEATGFEGSGWRLESVGRSDRPLSTRDIVGNRFRVAVRDLTRADCELMTAARRFLAVPHGRGGRTLRFVNYYGDQRFGSARQGRGFAARRLVEGDFEGALRLLIATPGRKDARAVGSAKRSIAARWGAWAALAEALPPSSERSVVARLAATRGDFREGFAALPPLVARMTIEAYQSRLWNEIARRLVLRLCPAPLIRARGRFGELLFPPAAALPAALEGLDLPLLGPRTALREPWKGAAEEALSEEGLAPRDLRIPGLRFPYFGETPRALFVDAREFFLGPAETDERAGGERRFLRRVGFVLPRGSYATVLLGALGEAPQSTLR